MSCLAYIVLLGCPPTPSQNETMCLVWLKHSHHFPIYVGRIQTYIFIKSVGQVRLYLQINIFESLDYQQDKKYCRQPKISKINCQPNGC